MIRALVIGRIHGKPLAKVAPSGRRYAVATLITDDPEPTSISLIGIEEIGDQLAALAAGTHCSVTGKCSLSAWLDKTGCAVAAMKIVIDALINLEKPTRRRSPWPYPPKMTNRQRKADLRKIVESET